MAKFEFFGAPRIMFGRGTFARLPELAAPLGTAALIVHSLPQQTLFEGLLRQRLDGDAFEIGTSRMRAVQVRQSGEPTTAHVDRCLAVAQEHGCDCVIAVGGGSAIDCAKAVAGLMTNGGVALDYMEVVGKGQKITKAAAPWIAVPCTAGTGAEVTRNAVIGYPEKKFKASIRSELLLPRVVVIDPELAVGVRAEVTAASGMDALCQCIEAYTSSGANAMTDALALEGVMRAARSLKRAYDVPGDLDAREDMALAALWSGMALTNAGLGAVHGFAAPLGASYPVPHGVVCAALLPGVMRANVAALRTATDERLGRYAAVGRAMCGAGLSDDAAIDAAIRFVEGLARELRIPRLGTYGITSDAVAGQVELAQKASSMRFNPVVLSRDVLEGILVGAL